MPDYAKIIANRKAYLLDCVELGDWHGVSDAANDIRVLETRQSMLGVTVCVIHPDGAGIDWPEGHPAFKPPSTPA